MKRIQESTILRHGRFNNSRVEGMRNRNLYRLNAHIRKHFNCIINRFGSTGNNGLGGAVLVGHSHVTVHTGEFGFYSFHCSGNRSHFTIVFYANFAHHFTAGTNSFQPVFKIKNTGSHRSSILTQTMPHNHVGLNAKRRQQAHHGNIGGQHSRLSHFGSLNSSFALGDLLFGFAGFAPQSFR